MAILAVVIVSSFANTQLPHSHVFCSDTAFIASRGGWMYCDDSNVKPVDPKQVVVRQTFLFIGILI